MIKTVIKCKFCEIEKNIIHNELLCGFLNAGLNAGHKFTVGDQKVRLKVTAGEDAVGWQLLCPVMSSMEVGHPFIYDNCSEVQLQLKMF